ncbi:caspase domain-containing protein [Mycena maculata]|uniref:Caspase domain-containing protein n=1 Tax=Mycena maculata TaxID=230809 RepID=A0AAD7HC45_9AGAR|nr:caspase domain-containing protein [Mycena maculata]
MEDVSSSRGSIAAVGHSRGEVSPPTEVEELSPPKESKPAPVTPPKESKVEGVSPPKEGQVFALVIGINDYLSNNYATLLGAVNDARAFKKYLLDPREKRGLGVPASNVLVLEDRQATRAGILAAFQSHFMDNPKIPDDGNATMILFYAGHGTRILAPENKIAPDGRVEAIAPVDERTKDAAGNEVHAIPDYVLGWLLSRLAKKKGPNITVIFDACHSGGLGRDVGRARAGGSPSPSVPLELDSHLWKDETGAAQTAPSFRMWSQSAPSHVLLAACGQEETAREIRYIDDNSVHGRFTESLITWLRRVSLENTTYQELLNRFPAWSGQTPHCGGERRDRLVFDGNFPQTGSRAIPLIPHTSPTNDILQSFRVDMGSVDGVVPDTEFTVYGPDNNELCTLVAHSVETGKTILVPPGKQPVVMKDGQSVTIPPQSRAEVSDWKNDAMILHVYTPDDFPHTTDLFPKHDITVQPKGRKYVQASSVADADIIIRKVDDDIVIRRLTSTILECHPETRFPLKDNAAHLPLVADGIAHFNYFLERHHGSAPLKDFSLEMHRLVGDYPGRRPDLKASPRGDGNLVVDNEVNIPSRAGAKYGFTIRNTSEMDLFPYFFFFDPEEYTISLWYKPESYKVAPLTKKTEDADGTVTVGMGSERAFEFMLPPDQPHSSGFLKLFVATQHLDISWIKQNVSPFDPNFQGTPRIQAGQEPLVAIPEWDALTVVLTMTKQ